MKILSSTTLAAALLIGTGAFAQQSAPASSDPTTPAPVPVSSQTPAAAGQEPTPATPAAPMSKKDRKAQQNSMKHDETAADETAKADKETAKASKAKAKQMKHEDKATAEAQKAQPQ